MRARLGEFAEQHRESIVRYFRRKGMSPAAADDCAQETFIRIGRIELHQLDQPIAYLFRVASNVYLEHGRRTRSRREGLHVSIESVELVDRGNSPAHIFEGRQTLQRLAEVLHELPPRTKEVFLLNRMEGLTYSQLATRFGVSAGTIEKQISKALAHLRTRLDRNDSQ